MRTIDLVYFDAGGGHRAAANALKLVIERQGRPWHLRMMNLQEVLDSLDIFRKITGIRLQDIYNAILKKGWTLGSAQLLPVMRLIIRLYHREQVRFLSEYWKPLRPDMVVSLVPNFNRAMFEALRIVDPAIPFVTILTDFADFGPHFWMERQDQYLVCGTAKAVEQARALAYPEDRILRTSGMILHPRFHETPALNRAEERQRLGLAPDRPTVLVLFGGQGSTVMIEILDRLNRSEMPFQVILICGRNEKLADRLKSMPTAVPRFIEGFTNEVPYYMRLSDVFIGKPGPGSISEAVAMGLPVIVERNAWTLPQERYNTRWVEEHGVGIVLRSFREIDTAVAHMLEPIVLERYRQASAAICNRAVFEIPELLAQILEENLDPAAA
jgi:1,2-diacylglycerol 3-beta-galactosyltransferase